MGLQGSGAAELLGGDSNRGILIRGSIPLFQGIFTSTGEIFIFGEGGLSAGR